MKSQIKFSARGNQEIQLELEIPNHCPACNHLVVLSGVSHSFNSEKNELQLLLLCPNAECQSFAIAYYNGDDPGRLAFSKLEPPNLAAFDFPDIVKQISSTFVVVYKEAHEARARGLKQIAGPGYRKAFEFLIKDYAKFLASSPETHKDIENLAAGNVVSKFIPDARIQAVARRALWLGNDETHYLRKWEDQNIDDLITLIKLTIDWIDIEYQSKTYIDTMPEK